MSIQTPANSDDNRFRQMFPELKVAEHCQNETKMKYITQYGLFKYFKDLLESDFCNKAYTFKFDKSTTSQVKEQHDGYMQYWNNSWERAVIVIRGSFFVNHRPSKKLPCGTFLRICEKDWSGCKSLVSFRNGLPKREFEVSKSSTRFARIMP